MKILLYYHGGSYNHGCEAIVRTLCQIFAEDELILYSFNSQADREYGLDKVLTIKQCLPCKKKYNFFEKVLIYFRLKQHGAECYIEMLKENVDWAFSIGGDNYCYSDQPQELAYINKKLNARGIKTALIGCSIDLEVLERKSVIKDLKNYQVIVARESLTYDALLQKGLTNTALAPDTAFVLPAKSGDFQLDEQKKWVGLNISPLVVKKNDKVYENYVSLARYIIKCTDYNIALIPHVTVAWDSDKETIERIYGELNETERVVKVPEQDCEKIKNIVSQCKFIVCSRTHVSIAAYSQCIPTLVVGYSIKSKGIAKDLFGTYKDYVVSAKEMQDKQVLVGLYCKMVEQEQEMRKKLQEFMPGYKNKLSEIRNYFVK